MTYASLFLILIALTTTVAPTRARADDRAIGGMYSAEKLGLPAGQMCVQGERGPVNAERFFATVQCGFTCTGKSEKLLTRVRSFDPVQQGLTRGDGGLWAHLTTQLSQFGKRSCLEAASIDCGGVYGVAAFRYLGMESNTWKMPPAIGCGPTQEMLFSPYDISQVDKLQKARPTASLPAEEAGASLIPTLTARGTILKKDSGDCKRTVTADVCFGDCLCEPGIGLDCPNRGADTRWANVLGTRLPPATRKITVCADALDTQLTELHLAGASEAVRRHYCEEYVWSSIFAAHALGTTCAAYRGTVNCGL